MSTTPQPSPRVPNAAASSPRRWRDLVLLIGLIALVILGLAGLAAATGWAETKSALMSLSAMNLGVLLALSLVNYMCRGLRWHLFANRLGLDTGFLQDLRHFLGGFAMSVTPGRVGELIRMRWLRRETGWSFERTAPLVLVDRAADLAAMAILLALALALSTTGMKGGAPVAVLALGAAVIATRANLLYSVAGLAHRLSGRRFPRLFARVRRASQSLRAFSGPSILLAAGGLGLIGWLAEGYAFHMLLTWLGADIGLWMAVGVFIFATLAGGLTGAPGGLGGAEAAMVALLALDGVPLEIAVPATLVIRVTTLWFAILIGLAVFPFAEQCSKRAQDALET
ncbi:MAG: flippase-like domain-containing protein [Silicimonas sp.]|nr:flippase-like domain-containing protein [Silicimonas sp.]